MGLKKNNKVQEYLDSVCSQIKNSKVHKEVREEVEGHIDEIVEEYMEGGFTSDEAVNKAVAQMGDALLIGKELNRVHKQKPEWSIIILTLMFTGIGLSAFLLMNSSGVLGKFSLVSRSIMGITIGTACATLIYYLDYFKIKDYSRYIYLGTLSITLLTIVLGQRVNGIPFLFIGIGINFIDVSPFLFIIALAGILDNFNWSGIKNILLGLALLAVPALLILMGRSFSAAACYYIAVLVLLIISGMKLKYIFTLVAAGISLSMFYVLMAPYRIKRFLVFLYPYEDATGMGYLNVQLDKIISSAGMLGKGNTFDGRQLPNVHTEFIFTYIVYTFGWIAGVLLSILVILFLIRISHIAFYVKSRYGKLLICGLVAIFAIQFVWNIFMNLGLAPISGIGLPFISYGNSQFVVSMIAIGLISSIYKQRNIIAEKAA